MTSSKRRLKVPPAVPFAVVEDPEPLVDGGRFRAKAIAGDPLQIRAAVFAHGHELVRAFVRHRRHGSPRWSRLTMQPLGNDRFEAVIHPAEPGRLELEVLGEVDHLAMWRRDASRRAEVGVFELDDAVVGAALLREAARRIATSRRRAGTSSVVPAEISAPALVSVLEAGPELPGTPAGATATSAATATAERAPEPAPRPPRGSDTEATVASVIVGLDGGRGSDGDGDAKAAEDTTTATDAVLACDVEADAAEEPLPTKASAGALRELAHRLKRAEDAPTIAEVLKELSVFDEALFHRPPDGSTPAVARLEIDVQRELAACSAWYECFPRSTSPDPERPGTLRDLIGRLDYIAGLGFDICYLPPIHPIGVTARKGKNNQPFGGPDEAGSPWAIGNAFGGHTAIAPELGTIADFDLLVSEAARRGLEIALDLVFNCSPDHPWVEQHPDWFAHRIDGTIACAENPPKRYEDVYPIDFSTPDREALYRALLEVVRFWIGHGVRTFRVDNPHTKPFDFWEWLIGAIHEDDPGVIFLAEAFTRPRVTHRLAKLGFDQSYTYFTWRDTKYELQEYLTELAHGPGATYFRGNVWPNTPDILARSLQRGGRPAFVARLVLAACGSSNFGIYGPVFELLEDRPVAPGSEEYLNSEKYEVRHFDLDDPRSIAGVIRRVNGARRVHPALRRNDSLHFHDVGNDQLLCWSKRDERSGDTILCAVNIDPFWTQSGFVQLDLDALGLDAHAPFIVRDLLDDATYQWKGASNFLMLEPGRDNAHLFFVEPLAVSPGATR